MILNRKDAHQFAFHVNDIDSVTFTNQVLPDSIYQLEQQAYYFEEVKYDSLFLNDGFINYTGTISHEGEGFFYTDLINIEGASLINVYALMNNPYGGGISLYSAEGRFISSIYNTTPEAPYGSNSRYTVATDTLPEGTSLIRVQAAQKSIGEVSLSYKRRYGEPTIIINRNPSDIATTHVQDTAFPLRLDLPDIRHFYTLNFRARVKTFDTLSIIRGDAQFNSTILHISQDSVHVMLGDRKYQTFAHRLKITGMVNVSLQVDCKDRDYNSATLCIRTNGEIFARRVYFRGSYQGVKITTTGELFDPHLEFFSEGLKKDVWLFGDSYLDSYADSTLFDGHLNVCFDGHFGRAAKAALASFKLALKYAFPKFVVWAMGMNDKESGAMNTSWLAATEEMLQLCKEHDITPILCTIPNVPNISHLYKNDYIRNSGYRYIDVCHAMGADESVYWHEGYLSEDIVHPSVLGSVILRHTMCDNLPEIDY